MKNIILIIIGLTILPNKRPNFIHNLLKGRSKSWKNNEIIRIRIDTDKDKIAYKIKLFTIDFYYFYKIIKIIDVNEIEIPPAGLEPAIFRLEGGRVIQLRHGGEWSLWGSNPRPPAHKTGALTN